MIFEVFLGCGGWAKAVDELTGTELGLGGSVSEEGGARTFEEVDVGAARVLRCDAPVFAMPP